MTSSCCVPRVSVCFCVFVYIWYVCFSLSCQKNTSAQSLSLVSIYTVHINLYIPWFNYVTLKTVACYDNVILWFPFSIIDEWLMFGRINTISNGSWISMEKTLFCDYLCLPKHHYQFNSNTNTHRFTPLWFTNN